MAATCDGSDLVGKWGSVGKKVGVFTHFPTWVSG